MRRRGRSAYNAAMAEHTVKLRTPALDVSTVDVEFRVKRGGKAFGRLRISKGGVEWMQKSDNKKAFHMSWEIVVNAPEAVIQALEIEARYKTSF